MTDQPVMAEITYIKVQIPAVTGGLEPVAIFYNQQRTIAGEFPVSQELFDCMEGQDTAYAWVEYDRPTDTVTVEKWILDEENWPEW